MVAEAFQVSMQTPLLNRIMSSRHARRMVPITRSTYACCKVIAAPADGFVEFRLPVIFKELSHGVFAPWNV